MRLSPPALLILRRELGLVGFGVLHRGLPRHGIIQTIVPFVEGRLFCLAHDIIQIIATFIKICLFCFARDIIQTIAPLPVRLVVALVVTLVIMPAPERMEHTPPDEEGGYVNVLLYFASEAVETDMVAVLVKGIRVHAAASSRNPLPIMRG